MNTKAYYEKRNKRRRNVINVIIELTSDSKLANSLRDRGNKYLLNRFKRLELINGVLVVKKTVKKKKKVVKEEVIREVDDSFIRTEDIFFDSRKPEVPIKETKNERRRRLYKEAREKGYTPEEARKLRGNAEDNFNHILQFNKVLDNQSRYQRWATWGKEVGKVEKKIREAEKDNRSASVIFDLELRKENIYPKWITDMVKEVNEDMGFEYTASYGWSVVYHYYTEGGTIEFWKSFFLADPLNPNIYRAKSKLVVSIENRGRRLK